MGLSYFRILYKWNHTGQTLLYLVLFVHITVSTVLKKIIYLFGCTGCVKQDLVP